MKQIFYQIQETKGIDRKPGIADFRFDIPGWSPDISSAEKELSVFLQTPVGEKQVTAQFYDLAKSGTGITGKVVVRLEIAASESREIKIRYGEKRTSPEPKTELRFEKGGRGPRDFRIENEFIKLDTLPVSGHLWHLWNKKGSNKKWHHHEWKENEDKGGDAFHWSPNCWVAYPHRTSRGYHLEEKMDFDLIDWHYALGWANPETEIIQGPLFVEIRRKGVVNPHSEHTDPNMKRRKEPLIYAEVTYRFYDGLPYFFQSSRLETLADLHCFFIRNCQFPVFTEIFSHALLMPESPAGLLPGDEVEPALFRLMGPLNFKPYDDGQHSLSNILPPKLAYCAMFNPESQDAFATIQTLEKNTNIHSGKPVYQNHATLYTELYGKTSYFGRTFSYVNRRFNPENAVFLPKGERYDEENYCVVFPHKNLADTRQTLDCYNLELNNPLTARPTPAL